MSDVNIFNPKGFLTVGGIILVVVGILGFINIIGPDVEGSIFGSAWWFDSAENWAHTVLGVVALIVAYSVANAGTQKGLVALVGIVAILVAIYGFVAGTPTLFGANFETADNILHLVIGVWALVAAFKKPAPVGGMGVPAM